MTTLREGLHLEREATVPDHAERHRLLVMQAKADAKAIRSLVRHRGPDELRSCLADRFTLACEELGEAPKGTRGLLLAIATAYRVAREQAENDAPKGGGSGT